MAKATLPTNYKDDIMATPMGGLRRYRPIQNDDGTVSFEDVTDYTQVGSNFGAAQMNQTNTAVNNSADKSRIIDSLADVAANTQAGMMAGALAVRELNGNLDSMNKNAVTAFTVQIDDLSKINKTTIFQNTKILTLGSVSVPAWSIGIILASGGLSGINASILMVDMEGYLYYGIREDNRWIARKLIL